MGGQGGWVLSVFFEGNDDEVKEGIFEREGKKGTVEVQILVGISALG